MAKIMTMQRVKVAFFVATKRSNAATKKVKHDGGYFTF